MQLLILKKRRAPFQSNSLCQSRHFRHWSSYSSTRYKENVMNSLDTVARTHTLEPRIGAVYSSFFLSLSLSLRVCLSPWTHTQILRPIDRLFRAKSNILSPHAPHAPHTDYLPLDEADPLVGSKPLHDTYQSPCLIALNRGALYLSSPFIDIAIHKGCSRSQRSCPCLVHFFHLRLRLAKSHYGLRCPDNCYSLRSLVVAWSSTPSALSSWWLVYV